MIIKIPKYVTNFFLFATFNLTLYKRRLRLFWYLNDIRD